MYAATLGVHDARGDGAGRHHSNSGPQWEHQKAVDSTKLTGDHAQDVQAAARANKKKLDGVCGWATAKAAWPESSRDWK